MQLTRATAFSVGRKQVAAIGAISVLFAGLSVDAQMPQDAALRRRLLEEAQTARAADDHLQALALASRAGQIEMTPSVRLFIAEEQTAVRELAESWASAQLCSTEAQEDKGLKNRLKILSACNKLMSEIEVTAARVIVSMPRPVPSGAQLTIRGQIVPASLYGQPYFLTPGKVSVEATAPNYLRFHRELLVRAGEEVTVTSELVAQSPPRAEVKDLTYSPSKTIAASSQPSAFRRFAPYATIGLGVVSLGASAIFLLSRNDASNKLDGMCSGPDHNVCPDTPEARSLIQTVSTDSTLTVVTLGIGATAIAGGILWLLLDKPSSAGETRVTEATITALGGGAVVSFKGKF
jgi:hypothetical protein